MRGAGIFAGIISEPFSVDSDGVLEFLGDKLLDAWETSVRKAALDLAAYRTTLPLQAASNSPRGTANLIHDWLWSHLCAEVDDMEEVLIHDKGPVREVIVKDVIRIRLKRHHGSGAIAAYPTDEAIRFYSQDPSKGQLVLFEGLPEMIRLVFGYIWDRDLGEIGAATVSYPISRDTSLWIREIGPPPPSHVLVPSQPDAPLPTLAFPKGQSQNQA